MSKLMIRAGLSLLAATATVLMIDALSSPAEAQRVSSRCAYYGPGSAPCPNNVRTGPMRPAPVQTAPVVRQAPAQNYSYGRVTVSPNAMRLPSGAGLVRSGSQNIGTGWVAPGAQNIGVGWMGANCRRIPAGIRCF